MLFDQFVFDSYIPCGCRGASPSRITSILLNDKLVSQSIFATSRCHGRWSNPFKLYLYKPSSQNLRRTSEDCTVRTLKYHFNTPTKPSSRHGMLRALLRIMSSPKRVPIPKNGVDYGGGKIVLAPMVRSGELPCRMLALKYGADLVWGMAVIEENEEQCH